MSLRSRLFLGIAGTVLVSLVVTVLAGALLTRRSLEDTAVNALERQVALIAAQRNSDPSRTAQRVLGEFLATDDQRLAILSPAQAELLLPDAGAERLRAGAVASGSVDVRGTRFLYAARRNGDEAIVLLRPASQLAADWQPYALGLGIAGLVGAALAALVAFLLSRAVARPIARVSKASRALAAGEAPEPLPVAGPPEASTLTCDAGRPPLARSFARTVFVNHASCALLPAGEPRSATASSSAESARRSAIRSLTVSGEQMRVEMCRTPGTAAATRAASR